MTLNPQEMDMQGKIVTREQAATECQGISNIEESAG
jgi:hypothetical protein